MKINYCNINLLALFLVSALFGCTAKMDTLDNTVFIAEAESEVAKVVTIDEDVVDVPFTIRALQPVENDVVVTINVDQSVLDSYNNRYTQNYELLPAEYYSFDKNKTSISQSKVSADPFILNIKPLSQEMMTSGKKYAVPVSISSDGMETLSASKSFVYLISSPIITDVLVFSNRDTRLEFPVDNSVMSKTWSFEFLLNSSDLRTKNIMMFGMWTTTSTGAPYEIFTRFGDVMIDSDNFQAKIQGNPCNSATHFKPNEWYHIAGVCDGKEFILYVNGTKDNSIPYDGATIKLDDFYFGWTGGNSTIKLSELRLWKKALSAAEVVNNKYSVDSKSEGLVGYWKLNDKAVSFKDYTGKSADGKNVVGTISWQPQKWK